MTRSLRWTRRALCSALAALALAACGDQPLAPRNAPTLALAAEARDALSVAASDARLRVTATLGSLGGELADALSRAEAALDAADAREVRASSRAADLAFARVASTTDTPPAELSVVELVLERLRHAVH